LVTVGVNSSFFDICISPKIDNNNEDFPDATLRELLTNI
jgi:hypothetical protein